MIPEPCAPESNAVVLYDGRCGFCERIAPFVEARDRGRYFRFAALQSEEGQKLLTRVGLPTGWLDSVVLVEGERATSGSTAILQILRRMPWPWSWFFVFLAIPRPARDFLYSEFARRRYRWFGKADRCRFPRSE